MDLPKDFNSFAKGVEMAAAVRKRAADRVHLDDYADPAYGAALAELRDRKMTIATAQLDETERQQKPMTIEDWIDAFVELKDSEIGRRWQREMDRAREMGFVIERRHHRPRGPYVVGDDAVAPVDRKFWNTHLGQPWRPEGEQS